MKAQDLFDALDAYQSAKRTVARYAKEDTPKYLMSKFKRLERVARKNAESALDDYVRARIAEYFGADGK